jgi:hypothetical protein
MSHQRTDIHGITRNFDAREPQEGAVGGADTLPGSSVPGRISPAVPSCDSPHLIDGEFQSDKYPTTPRGKVPLSVKDTTAQDLLWEYAQRRRVVDAEFSADLETALRTAGYAPSCEDESAELAAIRAADALTPGPDGWLTPSDAGELLAYSHRRTLLRMMDKLTAKCDLLEGFESKRASCCADNEREAHELRVSRDTWHEAWEKLHRELLVVEKQRNELRSKLAEAEEEVNEGENATARIDEFLDERRCHLSSARKWTGAAVEWALDTEAKLAEAESVAATKSALLEMALIRGDMEQRKAEAAEARVREMSDGQWVGGKKVGHLDPDEGWMTPAVKIPGRS